MAVTPEGQRMFTMWKGGGVYHSGSLHGGRSRIQHQVVANGIRRQVCAVVWNNNRDRHMVCNGYGIQHGEYTMHTVSIRRTYVGMGETWAAMAPGNRTVSPVGNGVRGRRGRRRTSQSERPPAM